MAFASQIIITLGIIYAIRLGHNLFKNVRNANAIRLPVKIVPVDQGNVIWLLSSSFTRRYAQKMLPDSLYKRLNLAIFGWEFQEGTRPFDEPVGRHGHQKSQSFIMAGLGKLEFWTTDPLAIQDILHRTQAFEVPKSHEFALGQFGPNVMTTNGSQWARHRRIVTSVIDERISRTVFTESMRQAGGLLDDLFPADAGSITAAETTKLFDMLKKITIHVLMAAGMGKQVSWNCEPDGELEAGYTMSPTVSLTTIVANIVGIGMLPTGLLIHWPTWLPGGGNMRRIGKAKFEVQKRNETMIQEQQYQQSQTKSTEPNIISKLVQASLGSVSSQAMTKDEMVSNLFIFTAAGFETTATTLAFAMVLLARHPCWQEWIHEEVDSLTSNHSENDRDYAIIFPKAIRILSFMLEVVRLYPPAPHIHREITASQTVQTTAGPVVIPAGTKVYINSVAAHLLPSWRDVNHSSDPPSFQNSPEIPDELIFRPSRWINPPGSDNVQFRPPKGTFVPWAIGPRVCPGQKMAQIEFTAVILTLLARCRIEAVSLPNETNSDLETRLDRRLHDSIWKTVLEMNNAFAPRPGSGLGMRLVDRGQESVV